MSGEEYEDSHEAWLRTSAELREVKIENERLRAALLRVVKGCHDWDCYVDGYSEARALLSPSTPEETEP